MIDETPVCTIPSQRGIHDAPLLLDFQTPPVAVPAYKIVEDGEGFATQFIRPILGVETPPPT